ncbi:uncharacterized protein LOC122304834 [Carya illinoinensis]|uniref:uncharacterized protein LOC122304834 n=1 Tax=Carya illinoinensis TaxID=32201 RepID=UPI001C71F1DD|nr:uncharacterized protein LOC122304834 [Carya illinoinensis]
MPLPYNDDSGPGKENQKMEERVDWMKDDLMESSEGKSLKRQTSQPIQGLAKTKKQANWKRRGHDRSLQTCVSTNALSMQAYISGGSKRGRRKLKEGEEDGGFSKKAKTAVPPVATSCLSWNYRGLGNPRTVRELHTSVKNKSPNFIFLIETVRTRFGFDHSFVIDSKGLSGGIAFLWRGDHAMELESYTRNHISLRVTHPVVGKDWILVGFYGNPLTSKSRLDSWRLLKALRPPPSIEWLCLEDFNEILHQNKKYGAAVRPYSHMEALKLANGGQ